MIFEQILILGILAATIAMFLWGRWRHDMVAVAALLACLLVGLVPMADAFRGFGHPAVITVACVLVLSQGLQNSGAVDALARIALPSKAGPNMSIAALAGLVAMLSAFMNNVGALALLMPVAIQIATRLGLPPGQVLMPLAFASILGGTVTLIGTPPNLIVSGFRDSAGLGSFGMFDFSPVGAALTAVGAVFIALIGWRLVPARKRAGTEGFETGAYLTEARVTEGSKAAGMTLREIERRLDDVGAQIVGLVWKGIRLRAPSSARVVEPGDILIVEAEAETLAAALSQLELKLEEDKRETKPAAEGERDETRQDEPSSAPEPAAGAPGGAKSPDPETAVQEKPASSDDAALVELAVLPRSPLAGRSASDIMLRSRYGINLLAVSRQGTRSMSRLRTMQLAGGDVLLMQGAPEVIFSFASSMGCLPLAGRALRIPDRRKAIIASTIMLAAVGIAALGLLPPAATFAAGVLATMAFRTVPRREVYDAVDWPVIVLLAALLPVAGAMQTTGAADLIAHLLLDNVAQGNAVIGLVVILVTTMLLTDLMNNAATAAVMAPIGLGAAVHLGVNADTFLMAVAIGASCAFLTPIGHQNNTLILGPGGFRFGDYWKMGLPLDVLVVAVSIPMLLLVWPL